jgi:hypothetical protein
MAFIDRMIGQDEKIICRANPHWIYILQGFLLLLFAIATGFTLDTMIKLYPSALSLDIENESVANLFFYLRSSVFTVCLAIGIILFLHNLIFYRSTHVALTSDRLIYKTGMFFVNVHESSLDEIKGEQVHNGFFGRFLDYGFLQIDCRFVKNMYLPAVAHPYAFLHNLHKLVKKKNLKENLNI